MYAHELTKAKGKLNLERLSTLAPDGLEKDQTEEKREKLDRDLFELQDLMWGAKTHSVLVVLQGRDTAGKDGTIKGVVGALNPRGVNVLSFGVPTEEERQHDFLWRIHRHAPRLGEFAIFNRSHYEDVLVVRVHDLAPKKIWSERYDYINSFEDSLAAQGCIVLKFFLHISKGEQKKRLLEREDDATKAWKLNPSDWRERAHWGAFTNAYEDALTRCVSKQAPWYIVPADQKWYRNLCVSEAIVKAMRPYRDQWLNTLAERGKIGRSQLKAYKAKHSLS
jgi:PPK2 family polyphosphate:nucleotide phosphotransferase